MMESATILLLEDDPIIAMQVQAMIEDLGHRPLPAATWAEAEALCWKHLPDYAILNYCYPAFDGMQLASRLRVPFFMKILFLTGARPTDLAHSPTYYPGHEVLYKPFTHIQLQQALRHFLPCVPAALP
jgi:CheY-like chemotaxis protein